MSKVRPSTQLAQDGATAGQVLTWDGTNSKWAPAAAPGGGSGTYPDGTAATTVSRPRQLADIRDYPGSDPGAKIMAAAQDAVTNWRTLGGVYVPAGSYTLTSRVDFRTLTGMPSVGWLDGFTFWCDDAAVFQDGTTSGSSALLNFTPPTGTQFLRSTLKLGLVNGVDATHAGMPGVVISAWNNSTILIQGITHFNGDGLLLDNAGTYGGSTWSIGTFNNDIRINQLGQNGGCGMKVLGRGATSSPYGVQGNVIHVGDVIENGSHGVSIGSATNDNIQYNHFILGVSEHNGGYGVIDYNGLNRVDVANTNSNTSGGYALAAGAVGDGTYMRPYVRGYFNDGYTLNGQAGDVVNLRSGTGAALTDPTTTKGDLIVHGTSTTRFGVGVDGQVLTADSTQTLGVKWATPAATGAGELLMTDGVTNPPVPVTTEDGSDWLYQG